MAGPNVDIVFTPFCEVLRWNKKTIDTPSGHTVLLETENFIEELVILLGSIV